MDCGSPAELYHVMHSLISAIQHCPEVYITCMSPRNHAACNAILSGHSRTLLAQFGLTPKSKRGLAVSDPGEPADPLDEL
jgi:hypothetical protein